MLEEDDFYGMIERMGAQMELTRLPLIVGEAMRPDEYGALSEIAFLTGYSEQSAFNRAFKRWMGVTPAAYRKSRG